MQFKEIKLYLIVKYSFWVFPKIIESKIQIHFKNLLDSKLYPLHFRLKKQKFYNQKKLF